ncbi:tyrosine-type recombinase/integrase [Bifidobacterium subtile]|uniref:tyrosine-type recombinase/integrase n=1 Tax=Bifidobacterium subtile TaxID=77635 RepID=UPI00186741F9|nr:tyrosine-type recombinase/integrase [Bifidobacterium subtile]
MKRLKANPVDALPRSSGPASRPASPRPSRPWPRAWNRTTPTPGSWSSSTPRPGCAARRYAGSRDPTSRVPVRGRGDQRPGRTRQGRQDAARADLRAAGRRHTRRGGRRLAVPRPILGPLLRRPRVPRRQARHRIPTHSLRRRYGRIAYEASGYDLRAVQELLGHESPATTQSYIFVPQSSLGR